MFKATGYCILIPLRSQQPFRSSQGCRERKQDQLTLVSQGCWPPPNQREEASPGGGWRPMQWAKSKWRVWGSGGRLRDTFGDAEFHFTWKNEDTRKLSTSLLPPLRSLSGSTWPSSSESPQIGPIAAPPPNQSAMHGCSKIT